MGKSLFFLAVIFASSLCWAEKYTVVCQLLLGDPNPHSMAFEQKYETVANLDTDKIDSSQGKCVSSPDLPDGGYVVSVCKDKNGNLYFLANLKNFNDLNVEQRFSTQTHGGQSHLDLKPIDSNHPMIIGTGNPAGGALSAQVAHSNCHIQ